MSDISTFTGYRRISKESIDYEITEILPWEIGKTGSGWWLIIEEGTIFQISVPQIFRGILNPHDERVLLAAAIHDELLNLKFDVAFASSEFRRAAKDLGAAGVFAWALFFSTFIWTFIGRQFEIFKDK